MKNKKYDFCGYATKVGLKCTDGRTILHGAFDVSKKPRVPLVWAHGHDNPKNVLGHAVLENREDGTFAYGYFNDTEQGKIARELVAHGDISCLSIFANSIVEQAKKVSHGEICEVSLVIAGANPGARIENLAFEHGDGEFEPDMTEAIITTGEEISHSGMSSAADDDDADDDDDDEGGAVTHADGDKGGTITHADETLGDVFDTYTPKQKNVFYALLANVVSKDLSPDKGAVEHSGIKKTLKGDDTMRKNLFETTGRQTDKKDTIEHDGLTAAELKNIFADAKNNSTLKQAFIAHGYSISDGYSAYVSSDESHEISHDGTYGVNNLGYLFPDYAPTSPTPLFIQRDTGWVAKVFNMAKHVPYSRLKTVLADITEDEARALGYIKGKQKKEEVFTLLKRTTDPQTVYKKQKLDRDDVNDITGMDVVSWIHTEMRGGLEEEIARAQLVGDNRSTASDDKIKEDKIRPIATDDPLYTVPIIIEATATVSEIVDKVVLGRKQYKGTGMPSFFTTPDVSGDMLLLKDKNDRRIYNTEADLAAGLRVKEIVEVPVMENKIVVVTPATTEAAGEQRRLIGISVNMTDYQIGADKGGSIESFDDFDIDFNQYKYLIETRCCGALTVPHSAIAYWKTEIIEKLPASQG